MTYGFDAEHLMVWIDSYDRVTTGRDGVLCRRHADAMVVPLGWMLDDRRDPVPRLFKSPEHTTATSTRPRRGVTHHRSDAEQLQLGMESAGSMAVAPAATVVTSDAPADERVQAVEPEILPWKPMFDHSDDLDGLLEARSPLLARAFGGKRRRRPSA